MNRINVTKTFLPPIEEYQAYLRQIWEKDQLTNHGPLLLEFENKVSNYLGVDNFNFVTNGTIALQIAIRALGITEGEVITTPFSYVATTSSILWQNCQPVFVDIKPDTFCIDSTKIEQAITDKTKAILAVHVFGNACEIEKIDTIAAKHGLKVIYDAAHAFGAKYKGKSLLSYGDISICSFHSTKRFHTIEGGCVISKDKKVSETVELMRRFGHTGDDHFQLGINAKASEFQAAMGLCNLKYFENNVEARKKRAMMYDQLLDNIVQKLKVDEHTDYNYAYYPVVFESEEQLNQAIDKMNRENIYPRRYFYPSLNNLPYIKHDQSCPVSEDISSRILCLPLYESLGEDAIAKICELIKS